MPSSSATAAACTAPAPPNGSSVKAERSTPRLAANTRTSSAMRMSTMRWMPAAASSELHLQRLGDLARQRRARRRDVEHLRAAEEIFRIEKAADQVGVGDGRPRAAAPVADRARIGAGALRADIEKAAAVDPGDRAAAGRDRGHVERRHVDLPARDGALGHLERHAALDEGDVGAGAAHVERDEAGSAPRPPPDGRWPARRRPGRRTACARCARPRWRPRTASRRRSTASGSAARCATPA